jgi:transposase
MSEEDAAEYVGVSVAQFRRERDAGIWPLPVQRGCRRNTYDRKRLDQAVDRLEETNETLSMVVIDIDREFGLGTDKSSISRTAKAR